jgi:hypothetical protein
VSVIDSLITELSKVCASLPDRRKGPLGADAYTMSDIGLAAFSIFFMGSPSFLANQTALAAGQGRSNCQTLFGMTKIPTDNYIRLMLDGASPAAFDALFGQAIAAAGPMEPFQCLGGRRLIALDGTEYFRSRKIHCEQCLTRKRSDGGTEYCHSFLGATLVAPGHTQVMPLPPEFIVSQDGAEKQDCERNAAKRWLAKHGPGLAQVRPVYLGDDLFACQPIVEAIKQAGGSFVLTCKPSSHKTAEEYLYGAKLEEYRRTVVPLRATADAVKVTWLSVEIFNAKGKRTYRNSFVTDLEVTAANVAELAACGRARWKIENETFNVLKTCGYHLEHNFGHGKQTLASVLVVLNLLAFAMHTAARLAVLAWKAAMHTTGAIYRFFEHLRTVTTYVVFQSWDHLLRSIADAAIRPP